MRALESQPAGSVLMYYWSTLTIRLAFGSFIVAILVGAFNKVMASEEEEKRIIARDKSLAPNMYDDSMSTVLSRAVDSTGYFLTGSIYSANEVLLIQELQRAIQELEEEDPRNNEVQLIMPEKQVIALFGERPAERLLRRYGARHDEWADGFAMSA